MISKVQIMIVVIVTIRAGVPHFVSLFPIDLFDGYI